MVKILVLDNYDSFVYTLNGYLQQLGADTEVLRNDIVTEAELPALMAKYDAVLLSPGPGTPADAGLSIPAVKQALVTGQSVFGVCLGHQAIAEAMGATVTSAEELMHGKTSQVSHDGSLVYQDVPEPFTATRYHSLAVVASTVPEASGYQSDRCWHRGRWHEDSRWGNYGNPAPVFANLRCAVPPRERAHSGWLSDAWKLAGERGPTWCRRKGQEPEPAGSTLRSTKSAGLHWRFSLF